MTEIKIRMPAEWEPQSAIMLTWPHSKTDWKDNIQEVENVFLDITNNISRYQKLIICCYDKTHLQYVDNLLQNEDIDSGQYNLYIAPSNDSWARDHGPISILKNEEIELLDFRFNGWGNKFPFDLDDSISKTLHQAGAFKKVLLKSVDMVMEGGAIDANGSGTILTSEACILSSDRNPELDNSQIQQIFKNELGINNIIWINGISLIGDDTDGHVDMVVRFINHETLVYTSCDNPEDGNYRTLQMLEKIITGLSKNYGVTYTTVALPTPLIKDNEGNQLPASYINFLFCNEQILIPTYNHSMDIEAIDIFKSLVPDRKITGINCLPLIVQHGSLHCVTMHLPIST